MRYAARDKSPAASAAKFWGQEFLDAVDGMIGDAGQHVAQVSLGVEAVEFGGADQAVDRGGALAAGVRAC